MSVRNVIYQQHSLCTTIKTVRLSSKSFISSRVPDLQFDFLVLSVQNFHSEIHTYCGVQWVDEILFSVSTKKRGFANFIFSHNYNFEAIVELPSLFGSHFELSSFPGTTTRETRVRRSATRKYKPVYGFRAKAKQSTLPPSPPPPTPNSAHKVLRSTKVVLSISSALLRN